jgi:hypothetical protein
MPGQVAGAAWLGLGLPVASGFAADLVSPPRSPPSQAARSREPVRSCILLFHYGGPKTAFSGQCKKAVHRAPGTRQPSAIVLRGAPPALAASAGASCPPRSGTEGRR